jgi:membrane protein implicated in regulation of membrane protease activity
MSAHPTPAADGAGAAAGSADPVLFEERLWPSVWIWIIAAGIAAAVILVLAPINLMIGYVAAVVVAVILAVLLIASTPRLLVTAGALQVGRARIERRYIGAVEAFRGEDATRQRGPALNGTAYLCIRGWIDPVVRIEITDEADLTPYWLTSTRRPAQLVAALTAPVRS